MSLSSLITDYWIYTIPASGPQLSSETPKFKHIFKFVQSKSRLFLIADVGISSPKED